MASFILDNPVNNMKISNEDNKIVAYPMKSITSLNAGEFEQEIRAELASHPGMPLVIDAISLDYISSAGLRVLLVLAQESASKLTIRNVVPTLYEIFDMTGFTELLNVEKKMHEISVDGCEIVGRGAYGTVYRIDEDTIVKVYDSPDSLPLIKRERDLARKAFVMGVPTAISYDIVKVGGSYASVFELLKANILNDILVKNPDKIDEIIRTYANLIKRIHSVEVTPGSFPRAKDIFLAFLEGLKDVLPSDIRGRLTELIEAIPEDDHVVHGDIHMKNIMMNDSEPLVIDMETLSCGDPVFDLQGLFTTYVAYLEDEHDNNERFMGISYETSIKVYEKTVEYYFDGLASSELQKIKDRISLMGYVRFLDRVVVGGFTAPELKEIRIEHAICHIKELLDRVDKLNINN